ncbi:MAG: pyridoxamine 5'-phosphate oxidase family protein [Dehalococcoidia bacterium]|nr:pyridoxamine 5'-phosphate oxidase family protein [Dehalococcoidia bacterium]
MIRLTGEMREAFANALAEGAPALLATASAACVPDVAFKGSLIVWDDEHLAFWERSHGRTLRNIAENPHVCVHFRNAGRRLSWKLFGRARLIRTGDLREQIMAQTPEAELRQDPERRGIAVLIAVDEVRQGGETIMTRD